MTARISDANGWFRVERNPISRVGVFPYLGRSIGKTGEDADRVFQVYRPAEELGHPEALASFKSLPVVMGHRMLGDEDLGLTPVEKWPAVGATGDAVEFDEADGIVYAPIKVWSKDAANRINARSERDISCGYRCQYDFTPGEFNGQKYDVVQRRMRGNHVAVVKKGRMGSDIAVLDSQFTYDSVDVQELKPVLDKEVQDAIDATVTSAVEKALAEQPAAIAQAVADAMPEALKAAMKKDDEDEPKGEDSTLKAALDAATAQIAALQAQIAAQPKALDAKDIMSAAADRDALYQRVKPHVGVFEHGAMDADELAKYACDKLGLKAAEGAERAALDGFLHNRPARVATVTTGADSNDTDAGVRSAFVPSAA